MEKITCTGRSFDGLVNLYTGEPMVVVMHVRPGKVPMFSAPDTFDPTIDTFPTSKEAFESWTRVDGLKGLRSGVPACPYTGETMRIEETSFGYRFVGGFRPKMPQTREEFLAKARARGSMPEIPQAQIVEPVAEDAPIAKTHELDMGEHVEDAVRTLVDGKERTSRKATSRRHDK